MDDEDEAAQGMEMALLRGNSKGAPYLTRSTHGMIPAGTSCNIWRTKSMTMAVEVFVEPPKDNRTKSQTIISYEHQVPPRWVVYEYRAFSWICEGVEKEDELREKLVAYFNTLKRKPKVPDVFKPF
jgi:hypothetical protein